MKLIQNQKLTSTKPEVWDMINEIQEKEDRNLRIDEIQDVLYEQWSLEGTGQPVFETSDAGDKIIYSFENGGQISLYLTGETRQGSCYKDEKAFQTGEGVCYIGEYEYEDYVDILNMFLDDLIHCSGEPVDCKDLQETLDQSVWSRESMLELCNNQEEIAGDVLNTVDWQSPSTYFDEMEREEEISLYTIKEPFEQDICLFTEGMPLDEFVSEKTDMDFNKMSAMLKDRAVFDLWMEQRKELIPSVGNDNSLFPNGVVVVHSASASNFLEQKKRLDVFHTSDGVYMGYQHRYDNHGHYDNRDGSLRKISDSDCVFHLLCGEGSIYPKLDTCLITNTSKKDFENYEHLMVHPEDFGFTDLVCDKEQTFNHVPYSKDWSLTTKYSEAYQKLIQNEPERFGLTRKPEQRRIGWKHIETGGNSAGYYAESWLPESAPARNGYSLVATDDYCSTFDIYNDYDCNELIASYSLEELFKLGRNLIDEYVELTETLIKGKCLNFQDYLSKNQEFYGLTQEEVDHPEELPFGNLPELVDWKLEQIKEKEFDLEK